MDRQKLLKIIAVVAGALIIMLIIALLWPNKKIDGTSISKIVMAREATETRQPVNQTNIFSTSDNKIVAIVSYSSLPAGIKIDYRWYDVDDGEVLILSDKKSPDKDFRGNSVAVLARKDASWQKGSFEFRVYINEQLLSKREFVVKTPSELAKDQTKSIIKSIDFGNSVDLYGNIIGKPKTVFDDTSTSIYASIDYEGVSGEIDFEGRWRYLEGDRFVASYKKTISEDGVFAFSIDVSKNSWLPAEKWAKGRYKLEIYLDGELITEELFSVE